MTCVYAQFPKPKDETNDLHYDSEAAATECVSDLPFERGLKAILSPGQKQSSRHVFAPYVGAEHNKNLHLGARIARSAYSCAQKRATVTE